ncbi:NAD(P)H-dependent oxidoreductase [Pectinatus sottacetonis]|uniref:NAD(P)H-dependent oxidoreductase n=1 Tax=Pectinatus sottacetonis TaxID=1002795 RepID=UPI001E5A599A|nr:NAD(P)H-dependent oxidoreductase [Pectinatus sottacetonis]
MIWKGLVNFMKPLIILAHPDINNSNVNNRWKQELEKYSDEIITHELYKEYPDWNINVRKEQYLLEHSNCIILQFPIYWYSCPPLLKKWLDDVFTHGWAYGSKGNKLKGKKIGLAISIGDKEKNYMHTGHVGFSIDEIITPFKATVNHIGATMLPIFSIFNASFQISPEVIEQSASKYIEHISTVSL